MKSSRSVTISVRSLKGRTISDARRVVSLTDILEQTCLADRLGELSGRSVLMAVSDQLISGLVMTELDGVARRMLLCPPDLNADHLQTLMEDADIDAVVTDQPARWADADIKLIVTAGVPTAAASAAKTERATEWLMLTSGTSGVPKIVGHTLEGLTGAIVADSPARNGVAVWATFYDIRRYGGLQIFLRAIIGGGSMVLSEPGRAACRSRRPAAGARRHPHFRHAVALAQASDERIGRGVFPALRSAVGRDRRPGRARWLEPGLSGGLDRSCLCLDRGRRRLCRQRRP